MTSTAFIWDPVKNNVVLESDDDGNITTYTHMPALYGNVLSQNRNGVDSFYHYVVTAELTSHFLTEL